MNAPLADQAWRTATAALVSAEGPADAVLGGLIQWLDQTVPDDQDVSGPRWQVLTLMQLLAGRALMARGQAPGPVAATVEAAARYVANPTVEAYDHYEAAATDSYPFGTGESNA